MAIERGRLARGDQQRVLDVLARMDEVLGVLDPADWAAGDGSGEGPSDDEITALVTERQEARAARDFSRADAVRDQLEALNIVVEDTPNGPRWKRR